MDLQHHQLSLYAHCKLPVVSTNYEAGCVTREV